MSTNTAPTLSPTGLALAAIATLVLAFALLQMVGSLDLAISMTGSNSLDGIRRASASFEIQGRG